MSINENKTLWPNDLLEPVIITYNRAHKLESTLNAFMAAGLHHTTLHVLDNASTDNTPEVVNSMQAKWPGLQYHRNSSNIGGNANILRSVELSHSTYHWVIGDDDHWQITPDLLLELSEQLSRKQADVIRLGWLVSNKSRGVQKSGTDLAISEPLFFASLSLISSVITRRDIVKKYLPLAYQNIADSYPQLVPMIRAIEEQPLQVYTLSGDMLVHVPSQEPGYFAGDLEWYAGWYRTSRFFNNPKLKSGFVNEVTHYMCRDKPGKSRQLFWLLKVVCYYKSFRLNQWPYLLSMLAYGTGSRWQVFMLMVVNAAIPTFALVGLRKLYFMVNRLPEKTVLVDRTRL